jgi:hypothetical protein
MPFDTTQRADTGRFEPSTRQNSSFSKDVPTEIGRVRFAAGRAHAAPCARANKRTAGGGVTYA